MSKIYTRNEAARILDAFENVLIANGIKAGLYGSTYYELLDYVEIKIVEVLEIMRDKNPELVIGVFYGGD